MNGHFGLIALKKAEIQCTDKNDRSSQLGMPLKSKNSVYHSSSLAGVPPK